MEKELETPKFRVAAVVPAAGCGQRMGNPTPKQYLQVCGRPLILHCLKALEEVPWVERTVVVADDQAKMAAIVRREGLSRVITIKGTGSRHHSIRAGVEELSADAPDVVVVQDGVRPLMPLEILTQIVIAAETHGAAGAVRPLVSTVVKPDEEDFLQESLVRSQFLNSEMPQAFRFPVLRQAYQRCTEYELEYGTECLALALTHSGVRAKLIPGPPQLWKVTDEKDLAVAKILVPKYTRRIAVVCQSLASRESGSKEEQDPKCSKTPSDDSAESAFSSATTSVETLSEPCHAGSQVKTKGFETSQAGRAVTSVQTNDAGDITAKQHRVVLDESCLRCDDSCLRIYNALKKSLANNSKEVIVSSDLDVSGTSASSLILISNLEDMTTFEGYLKSLYQQLDKRLINIILILNLKGLQDVKLIDISDLQQLLEEASSMIEVTVTLVLRRRRKVKATKHRLFSEFHGETEVDQESRDTPHTTEGQSDVAASLEVNIPSGKRKSTSQGTPLTEDNEREATAQISSGDQNGGKNEDSRLANMIKAILDQPSDCFNGQVLLIEEH